MIEKNFNTRIQHKHDIEENWNKAAGFIPKSGEMIVYDVDSNHMYPRIKFGDGETAVGNLPFADAFDGLSIYPFDPTGPASKNGWEMVCVTLPENRKLQIGDLLLTLNGQIFIVQSVSDSEFNADFYMNIKGASGNKGADGNSIFFLSAPPKVDPNDNLYIPSSQIIDALRIVTPQDLLIAPDKKLYKVSGYDGGDVLLQLYGNLQGVDGVSATHKWNGTSLSVTSASGTSSADLKGATGERGSAVLKVSTAPSSYTTTTGGFTPAYRIALSTVLSQAKVDKVLIGDTILRTYYTYTVGYVDSNYVYLGDRASIRGAAGTTPVKGTDYFTDADKTEMVGQVKTAMPTLIVTGIDFDGISHTWEMYGVTR